MKQWLENNRILVVGTCIMLASLVIAWLMYGLFGHRLIQYIYENDSIEILNKVMAGKSSTPVENYYQEADRLMRVGILGLLTFVVVVVILVKTRLFAETALFFSSFGLFSLSLFLLFETFPSLIRLFHLKHIEYFAYRLDYVPDPTLVFRNRPLFAQPAVEFQGDKYSPLYWTGVKSITWDSSFTDQFGFTVGNPMASDVVVIGDSFIEFALAADDGFGKRLERISGLSVASFAVGGYGPFQYLELLRRYGIKEHPRYAFFGFFEGNDLGDIRQYLEWKSGGDYYYFSVLSKPFPQRYLAALKATASYIKKTASVALELAFNKPPVAANYVHPDIAVLQLDNYLHHVLLFYKSNKRPPDEIIRSPEWKELRSILGDFSSISRANKIVPIILYIPIAAHIYADRSTPASGQNWLKIRAEQIAAKANVESAMIALAKELQIEMIDLTPAFEAAARDGKLLYYPFDTHWNSEGREIAAAFVAAALENRADFSPVARTNYTPPRHVKPGHS